MTALALRYVAGHLAEAALVVALGSVAVIVALLLLVPVHHRVGDTRYCTGTGTGFGSDGKVVVSTYSFACGIYKQGDPDVTP